MIISYNNYNNNSLNYELHKYYYEIFYFINFMLLKQNITRQIIMKHYIIQIF